ncbi:MAG: WD40/YVTN/BNR-like repeat-containing protein [Thermoanaerobaculia bacterium]
MSAFRSAPVLLLAALAVPAPAAPARPPKAASATAAPALPATPPSSQLAALKARSIGPAVMGGRVVSIAVDPEDSATFYLGHATGGLWKTTNAGATFSPLMKEERVSSVGAVAVAPSDPRVVWVGTGEATDRNSAGFGTGVFRSTDGGATFAHVGLPSSRAIGRIRVHPSNADVAFVAVSGDLWTKGAERGLFRTTDGGKSWTRVLSAAAPDDADTGCVDVVLSPADPDVVYAALYARRRTPWSFAYGPSLTGGRDAGGVFRSTDGGSTWTKLAGGLPPQTGRIGLAVSASSPKVVMAVVQSDAGGTSGIDEIESRAGGVFRSEDGGDTWTRASRLNPRPFYFSQIRIDPVNDQRVYVLGYALSVSDDGGRTWREDLFGKVHPDCHELVATGTPAPRRDAPPKEGEPPEPERKPVAPRLLLGTDGGAYLSADAGGTWDHVDRIPSGQFYRISLDDSTPYRICGGLQDNVNWVGPSRTFTKDGIVNADWIQVGGGDGFWCVFDPVDRNLVYAESQEGYVHRFHLGSGQVRNLRPEPAEGQPSFRFHWNSPLVPSRHEKGTMFLAGNRVFRVTEKGETFTAVSPDLSTRELTKMTAKGSGAENYGVVYAFSESPRKAGLLWAGTDDGKLWVTEDGGAKWTDLTGFLPAAAKGQWIARVEAGRHDEKVAYIAVSAFRSGNHAPLFFRTADLGRSWASISGDLPKDEAADVIREDPKNPDLLYAGTEYGFYATLDRGRTWVRLGGLPTVPVDDIAIHERDRDLVVATHGRSLFVIDDVTALQELRPEVRAKALHLFPPRPAEARHLLPGWADWNGKAQFRGENPREGALLTFWVKEATGEPVKVSIAGPDGRPVANLTAPGVPGLGRVSWDLKKTKDLLTEYGGLPAGRHVAPGDYRVTVTHGEERSTQTLKVTAAEGVETR